jgi:ribonuclease HI
MKKRAKLYTDGGARGNPGPGGIGYVLKVKGGEIIKRGKYVGRVTNNQAEYMALLEGLKRAQREGVKNLDCFLDSELVVKQMNGQYRVKNPALIDIADEVREKMKKFEKVTFSHIFRERNKEADKLVNLAIDKYLKTRPV